MAEGGIDYTCLAQKRRDVVNYFAQYGWDTANLPAIFENWWLLDRRAAGDGSWVYPDLGTYAASLGCLINVPIGQPPVSTTPPAGVSGPVQAPPPPTFSFGRAIKQFFEHDPIPATALTLTGVILLSRWLKRE